MVVSRKELYNAIRPMRGLGRGIITRILSRIGEGPDLDLDVTCRELREASPATADERSAIAYILSQISEGGATRRLLGRRALAAGRR